MKEKRKLRDRLALKMVLPGDIHDHETADGGKNDQGLFDLEKIKTKKVTDLFFSHTRTSPTVASSTCSNSWRFHRPYRT